MKTALNTIAWRIASVIGAIAALPELRSLRFLWKPSNRLVYWLQRRAQRNFYTGSGFEEGYDLVAWFACRHHRNGN